MLRSCEALFLEGTEAAQLRFKRTVRIISLLLLAFFEALRHDLREKLRRIN